MVRYEEYGLIEKAVTSSNLNNPTVVDEFRYTVTSSSIAGLFTQGYMLAYYGSSVPAGWLVALNYVRDGAHVKLIVHLRWGNRLPCNKCILIITIYINSNLELTYKFKSLTYDSNQSISGIRGTIGGGAGEGLNPLDIVKFTSAYATLIRKTCTVKSNKIVVGRDARISGEMVKNVVVGTLMGMGWDVVDIDLASTPTTELAVTMEGASGGIILTASHNPKQWNALKLLNEKGEFLNAAEGQEVLRIAAAEEFDYAEVDQLGLYRQDLSYNQKHIDSVLALDLVDVEAIRKANFRVAIDCVNSVGGIILPQLLEQLGVQHVEKLYCEPTGNFQHNPEPLEKNLGDIMNLMKGGKADVAFVVDPDVDRLAMICEDGKMYGEEYTLVTVADYVLKHTPGNTVSNLSSTRALRDVTRKYGQGYYASAVGEVNVTTKMKEVGAVIGGEGNGGVIYPASHYGRDALVGIALFLSHLHTKARR